MKPQVTSALLAASLTLSAPSVLAELLTEDLSGDELSNEDLLSLSLEEVMTLEVTSVSRKKQRLMDSAAAVYVVTREDIRRSGAKTIPDALRMVPGVQVARKNSNNWSISTRGFNYIFANKLLVLMDGRTIYNPLFSGVNWEIQDTLLEDIDRIEVIRGPGAALWGANAVNGVINIITRDASETHGRLLTLGGGSEEKAFGSFRQGGEMNEDTDYRVYVKSFVRDGLWDPENNTDARDDWYINRAGFRVDSQSFYQGELRVSGDLYQGSTRPPLTILNKDTGEKDSLLDKDRDQQGGHIIAQWRRPTGNGEFSLKTYYDRYENNDYRIDTQMDSWDIESQHRFQWRENHELIWGLGYRSTWYELSNRNYVKGKDDTPREELFSAYLQDEITLNPNWHLTLSARLEHHTSTGYEFQPNARVAWNIDEQSTAWASLSRAVRTPAITERDFEVDGVVKVWDVAIPAQPPAPGFVLPVYQRIVGNPDNSSEVLTAFDLGYRRQFTPSLNLDIALFINEYKDLYGAITSTDCPLDTSNFLVDGQLICLDKAAIPKYALFPVLLANGIDAITYGLELAVDWQLRPWWRIKADVSTLQVDAKSQTNELGNKGIEALMENLSASYTGNIRSMMDLGEQWSFDAWFRLMGENKAAQADAYTTVDLRLTRQIQEGLEFSLVGQNLFDSHRVEYDDYFSGMLTTEVQRAWYAQMQWRF